MTLIKSLTATFVLLAAMITGLSAGFAAPARFDTNLVLWPSIFAQTIVAVGGLRPDWLTDPEKRSQAVRLLVIHHAAATVPYLVVWLLLPPEVRDSPLAIGLIWIAIVPTAAGLPAYATAARTAPSTITAFALLAYLCGLLITPLLALIIFGGGADLGRLVTAMLAGLIVPALLGVALGRWIRLIPARVRTGVVATSMLITTYVFGSAMSETLSDGVLPIGAVALALLVGAARVPISGALGVLLAGRNGSLRAPAALAAGYKNEALAASTALQVAGPVAVLPALGALLSEMVLMLSAAYAAYRADRPAVRRSARLYPEG
jgi:predicted Na+-dependent transporter